MGAVQGKNICNDKKIWMIMDWTWSTKDVIVVKKIKGEWSGWKCKHHS
jgi:hypothetical protein